MKRLFDILASSLALVLLALPLMAISLLISRKLGRPVLFRQIRPGLHEKPFTMYKFRSMTEELDPDGVLLPDNKRITDFGRFLRASSLDELPELWNVLKGEMSLVGPRPLLMRYTSLYSADQSRRHEVRPGLTGWAQINGRNSLTWEEKFKLDIWYVDNYNLFLDIKILWLTVIKVIARDGINSTGEVTMPEFTGSQVDDDSNLTQKLK
jgi:lipopolysaccharide/colanic/teichoic acid biosynthesis glycosyltransferase